MWGFVLVMTLLTQGLFVNPQFWVLRPAAALSAAALSIANSTRKAVPMTFYSTCRRAACWKTVWWSLTSSVLRFFIVLNKMGKVPLSAPVACRHGVTQNLSSSPQQGATSKGSVGAGKPQTKAPSGGILAGLLQTLPEVLCLVWVGQTWPSLHHPQP